MKFILASQSFSPKFANHKRLTKVRLLCNLLVVKHRTRTLAPPFNIIKFSQTSCIPFEVFKCLAGYTIISTPCSSDPRVHSDSYFVSGKIIRYFPHYYLLFYMPEIIGSLIFDYIFFVWQCNLILKISNLNKYVQNVSMFFIL